jgi:undecaprenyl-diphosphatase
MSTGRIVAIFIAAGIATYVYRRRRTLGGEIKVISALAIVLLGVYASGVLSGLPSFEKIIEDLAKALGKWTYLLVGAMAFLETGAFVGFIAPGEFTVILGGVVAGEGRISIVPLIGLVWVCAFLGDTTSFFIGEKVGRGFMIKHGPKLRITEERFMAVEDFFDRHGGKTIVIGRFLGFVRPLAPFIAGTSRMPYSRFAPYSILGTGLWGTTFCLLGYFFWQSFGKVSKIAGRASLALGIAAVIIVGGIYLYRRFRDPAERQRFAAWVERKSQHPLLRPLAMVVGPLWKWAGRPAARFAWPQIRFLFKRLTPGNLGLEFTTTLAVAAGGAYIFALYASIFVDDPTRLVALDREAMDLAERMYNPTLVDIAHKVTAIGSFPFVLAVVIAASIWLIVKRRPLDVLALAGGFGLVVLAVHLAKTGIDRPRPGGLLVGRTYGSAYPSGHAAYATAYVALAVIVARVLEGVVSRTTLVLVGALICATVGATRVYLRAHYLSDVIGGIALGLSIFALVGAISLVIGHVRHNESPPT